MGEALGFILSSFGLSSPMPKLGDFQLLSYLCMLARLSCDMYLRRSSNLFFSLKSCRYFTPIFLGSSGGLYNSELLYIYSSLSPFLCSIWYLSGLLLLSISISIFSFLLGLTATGSSRTFYSNILRRMSFCFSFFTLSSFLFQCMEKFYCISPLE